MCAAGVKFLVGDQLATEMNSRGPFLLSVLVRQCVLDRLTHDCAIAIFAYDDVHSVHEFILLQVGV